MYRCILFIFLSFGPTSWANAEEVWQWTDEAGITHLGTAPPETAESMLVYREAEGRIFQWRDEQGRIHFGDSPPAGTAVAGLREIVIKPIDSPAVDPERYSVLRQAERLAESNRQLEEARLTRKFARMEEERIAWERELLRMEQQINRLGYGPRPYRYPYAQRYGGYKPANYY